MNKKKILAVPEVCFWSVAGICLLGIIIGSVLDFRINEVLANKTSIGSLFATYGSYFSYCLYPAAGACLFVGLKKKGERCNLLAWVLLVLACATSIPVTCCRLAASPHAHLPCNLHQAVCRATAHSSMANGVNPFFSYDS